MTTPSPESPEPPEGYRLLTKAELRLKLPLDTIYFHKGTLKWTAALSAGSVLRFSDAPDYAWATRTPAPESEPLESKDAELDTAKRILQLASESPYAVEHLQNDECRLAAALVAARTHIAEQEGLIKELSEALELLRSTFPERPFIVSVCNITLARAAEAMKQPMSKTPETDAEAICFHDLSPEEQDCRNGDYVPADFARSLELRNAELTARIAELERKIEQLRKAVEKADLQLERAEEGLRGVCLILGFDPSDGEGTSPEDVVRAVERHLAEARKDSQRLDWLEKNHIEFAEELHRLGWNSPTDAQWEKLKFFLRRIRCAIDAAMPLPATPAI